MAQVVLQTCGFECETPSGAASQHNEANVIGAGGAITFESTLVRPGGSRRSLKVVATGAITYRQQPIAIASAVGFDSIWVMFPTLPPTDVPEFWFCSVATGTTAATFRLQLNNNKIEAVVTGGTIVQQSGTISANTWYLIDTRPTCAATTYKLDWWINGVAQTQALGAAGTSTIGTVGKPRRGVTNNKTTTVYYDDGVYGTSGAADGPYGAGVVLPAAIVAVGSGHNLTAGDLQDDGGTNLTAGETTSFAKVDEIPAVNTDFIKQVVARSTTYAAYKYARIGFTPRSVEQIVFFHNITTAADNQKAQLWDGTSAADAYALVSAGSVAGTIGNRDKQWAAAPSTGAWTTAKIDLAELRWGFSTDVLDVPAFDMSLLEVEVASADVTGTIAVSIGHPTVAATGEQTFAATAAPSISHPTVAAAGAETFAGTAGPSIGHPTVAATGAQTFDGAVAATVGHPVIAASGAETFDGQAASTIPHPAISATGTASQGVDGNAAVTIGHPAIAASGAETFDGTAAPSIGHPAVAASGAETFDGSATATISHPAVAASGAETFAGTAAAAIGAPALAAAGAETFAGPVAVTISAPAIAASGIEGYAGDAAVTIGHPSVAASGSEAFVGTAAPSIHAPAVAADGAEAFVGTGAVVIGHPGVAGSGAQGFAGDAAVAIGHPVIAGTAELRFLADGSLTIGRPAVAALGSVVNPTPAVLELGDMASSMVALGDAPAVALTFDDAAHALVALSDG